jgi:hypothetical protein
MVLRLVSGEPPGAELLRDLQRRLRADLDPAMVLQLERVERIDRSAAGKHRFVIGLPAAVRDRP